MKIKKILLILIIILGIGCLGSCDKEEKPNYLTKRYNYYSYLDTVSSIIIQFDTNLISEVQMEANMKKIDDILLGIEETFSTEQTLYMSINKIEKSLLMEVNENSGKKDENGEILYTQVNEEFIELLEMANQVSKLVNGSFDVTIGPLTSLWDISGQSGEEPNTWKRPTDEEILSKKALVNYQDILIDKENLKVALPNEGMSIDFGAIAKGYAADKVLEYIKTIKPILCMIDLGGNIYSYGTSPVTTTSIGIRNPFYNNASDSVYQIAKTSITDVSAVTSGTYERYIIVDGVTYHHLINPLTGYPFDNGIVSVSIIGVSSTMCDAIATGIYGLGLEAGLELVNSLQDYYAVFITNDKKVYIVGDIVFTPESGTSDFEFIQVKID